MFETFSSPMVEAYELDVPSSVYTPVTEFEVTQADIDYCNGFDDFEAFCQGKLDKPQQPENLAYMEGWIYHERRREDVISWREFCK